MRSIAEVMTKFPLTTEQNDKGVSWQDVSGFRRMRRWNAMVLIDDLNQQAVLTGHETVRTAVHIANTEQIDPCGWQRRFERDRRRRRAGAGVATG
jgi:hypothetical protein